jgi:hypothetical protein
MRESPAFERFRPFTSTQVFGATIGFPPSAFATSEITGEFCAQTEENGRIERNRVIRSSFIAVLLDGNHNPRGSLHASDRGLKGHIALAETRWNCQVELVQTGA